MASNKRLRSIGTHDGSFHADEVTACALLIVTNLADSDKVVRTRDAATLSQCAFVCDVGGIYDPLHHLFDHHQADYKGFFSSAGMVLLFLKEQGHLSNEEYQLLNHSLVQGVDAHDNGVEPHMPGVCTYSQLISNFTPINYEASPEEQNSAFQEALHFAMGHLKRILQRHRYIHSFTDTVAKAMSQGKDYLLFDQPIPWMDCFYDLQGERHPALFIIMPSGNHWKLRGIPPNNLERMKVRMPLPEEWAGLLEEDLKLISGIQGAIFCHKGRFFSLWETREDALKALNIVLHKGDKK